MSNAGVPAEQKTTRLTRREALGYAWLGSLALVTGAGVWLGNLFARPRPAVGAPGGTFTLPLADLPAVGGEPRNEPAGRFWLINTASGALSLRKTCTHLECLCEWDGQARQFVCPCHGSRFAEDGAHLEGPATRGLDRHPMTVRDASGAAVAQSDVMTGALLPLAVTQERVTELVLVIDTGVRIQGSPS